MLLILAATGNRVMGAQRVRNPSVPARSRVAWGLIGIALTALALNAISCRPRAATAPNELRVHAAASLADVLPRVYRAWSEHDAVRVSFHFDASSRLAREIEGGAPGDAFFSADNEWLDYLDQRARIARATRIELLGNALVLVVPVGSSWHPGAPSDLATPALERLALAGASVPAGRYARAALQAASLWPALEPRVVTGDSVRTTLAWVARSEASAGIVYATDARIEPRVRVAFTFAPGSHPRIVYAAAVIAGSQHPDIAARFLAFCRQPAASAIFANAGFIPLATSAP
jgi:molybdate transport system substrate-binding protein